MIMKRLFVLPMLLVATMVASEAAAQSVEGTPRDYDYTPSAENLAAREAFQDKKFGIFIHWGIYSMPAQGEWYMQTQRLTRDEYSKFASGFYPARYNAAEWVSAIKGSGAKYICFTSRHHDGFSMFDTAESDYDIVNATPFGRDVVRELAFECHKQGIALHFYYSHIDWYRDDYPASHTGLHAGRDPEKADWASYYRFMNRQLTELLTQYGPIGAIWFDGWWDKPKHDWQLEEQYALIHRLQPSCLIGNNHHVEPFPGEDIQIFERDLPGENKAGYSGQAISRLPLESCETMNGMWGYRVWDQNYKSTKDIIHLLVRAAGKNANLLLNIGPQPNGELPAASLERLREIGEWLEVYGPTIYGTRGGEVVSREWGTTTRKGDKIYVHILDWQDRYIFVQESGRVKAAKMFVGGEKVAFEQLSDGVILSLDEQPNAIDVVVELTVK